MVKKVTEMDHDRGHLVRYKTRKTWDIPWTRGPQTRGQKIARALWG